MKYTTNISIDRLKICYTVSSTTANEFISMEEEQNYGGFKIAPIKPIPPHKKSFWVQTTSSEKEVDWNSYAYISIGNKLDTNDTEKSENQYMWLEFENKTLYTPIFEKSDVSIASRVYTITDSLSMQLNNITRLEIAFDSNRNMTNPIKRGIMNCENTPIVNGKARQDMLDIIDEITYIRKANRKRYRTLSIYFKPKYNKKIILRAYDKEAEIRKSKKDYIRKFVGMPKQFHRMEIAVTGEAVNEFLNLKKMDLKDFLDSILKDRYFREKAFTYFSNRLIRFKTPEGIKSVLEI